MAIYNGEIKVAGGIANAMITLTKAEYDALSEAEKADNIYMTTDEVESMGVATSTSNGLQSATDKAAWDALDTYLLNRFYPIGNIYFSESNTNPGTFMGGTWVAWGQGRVPIGVGSIIANTDTTEGSVVAGAINKSSAGILGGEKVHALSVAELAQHSHDFLYNGSVWTEGYTTVLDGAGGLRWAVGSLNYGDNLITIGQAGSNTAHNNVQPYITCYMWKRTA